MNDTWFTDNGWKVVHRNVGLCEDSLGLGLTSFTEEKLGEKGWFSLLLAELTSRAASIIASVSPQVSECVKVSDQTNGFWPNK